MTPDAGDPVARLLRAADTPAAPRPEFADDLLRRLLHELAPEAGHTAHRAETPSGSPPRQQAAPSSPPLRLPDRGKAWALSHLATAALVLLVLAASLSAAGVWRFGREGMLPAITLEAPATPCGTLPATPPGEATPVTFLWRFEDAEGARLGLAPQIAVAPDGNVWVVDAARDGFQIVSPAGEPIERWGTSGTGDGQFNFQRDAENAPGGIAFLPDGGFYVLETQNRRVQQFAPDRTFVRAWGDFGEGDGQFVDPVGIVVDGDGNVYIQDARRDDVQKFDATGEFLLRFSGSGDRVPAGAMTEDGDVLPDSHLWFPDPANGRVRRFGPDGRWLETFGRSGATGELRNPQAVAVDAAGRLFVADAGNARVAVFAPDGQFLFAITGGEAGGAAFRSPVGIALDGEGNIYVLDRDPEGGNAVLQKFRVPPAV